MSIVFSWVVLTLSVWGTAQIVTGMRLQNMTNACIVAAIFGVLNVFIGWLLFALIVGVTLGVGLVFSFLTRWLVDAIVLELTDQLTDRIEIDGFGTALIAALLMSLFGTGSEWLLHSLGWMQGGM